MNNRFNFTLVEYYYYDDDYYRRRWLIIVIIIATKSRISICTVAIDSSRCSLGVEQMITLSCGIYFNNCRECVLGWRARRAEIKSANLPRVTIYIIISPTLRQIRIKPSGLQITGVAGALSDENHWWSISVGQVASDDANKLCVYYFVFNTEDFLPRAVTLERQPSLFVLWLLTALPAT